MRAFIENKLQDTAPPDDPHAVVPFNTPGDLPAILRLLGRRRLTPAAVLVPVVERPDGLTVLLTQRAETLKHHPGQISFPGGRIEQSDADTAAAAKREAFEEIGLDPGFVEVRGYLDNYLTIMRKDRKFGDDAARDALLRLFDVLGDDPAVTRYRARMFTLLH